MNDAAAMYLLRAEECFPLALEAQDEAQRTAAVEMALYWFEQAEQQITLEAIEKQGRAEGPGRPPEGAKRFEE